MRERRIYYQIRWGMFYWGARMLLGWDPYQANALATRRPVYQYVAARLASQRAKYRRLRDQGMTAIEAYAKIHGTTPEEERARLRVSVLASHHRLGQHGRSHWIENQIDRLADLDYNVVRRVKGDKNRWA